jgi:hypothetical protein
MIDKTKFINYLIELERRNSDHPWLVSHHGRIELLSTKDLKQKKAQKLKLTEIIEISKKIFNECTLDEKVQLTSNIAYFIKRREKNYYSLNFICQIFAKIFGYKRITENLKANLKSLSNQYITEQKEHNRKEYQMRLEKEHQEMLVRLKKEHQKMLEQEKIKKQARLQYLEKLVKSFENERFDSFEIDLAELDNFPPEELEESLLKLDKIVAKLPGPDKLMTLFLLYEKTAEKYAQQENYQKTLQIRLKASHNIPCAPIFGSLYTHIQKNAHPRLGCKLSAFGAGALKNHVLHAQLRQVQDCPSKFLYMEAKIHHHARKKLQSSLDFIKKNPQEFFKHLPKDFCSNLTTKENGVFYQKHMPDGSYEKGNTRWGYGTIEFEGVGSLHIGSNAGVYCNFNHLIIELNATLPEDQVGQKLYVMLASLGLGELVHTSRPMDEERVKIYQIFRAHFPAKAYLMERTQQDFETSLDKLKMRMIQVLKYQPDEERLQNLFKKHLSTDQMYQQAVYPDFKMWALKGHADEIRSKGIVGLMTGVGTLYVDRYKGTVYDTFENSARFVASMLELGGLSSQDRFQVGILKTGISSFHDISSGGGDSVFTRMVHKNWVASESNETSKKKSSRLQISTIHFSGHIQLLFDLKLLDRVGYALSGDYYGAKKPYDVNLTDPYIYRDNLIDFARKLDDTYSCGYTNEICIKHRIPPEYICGIQVQSEKEKIKLVEILREKKVIVSENEFEKINGVSIDEFIHVGNKFKESYWPQK